MNESLMRVVVDMVAFLALGDDSVVNQDAALEQVEHIASTLKALQPDDRACLRSFVAACAQAAEEAGDVARGEFLRSMPDHLGFIDGKANPSRRIRARRLP